MSDKLPAMPFYPGDWKKDPGIQASTLEEKGAWFELLLTLWETEDRGKLTLNGKPMSDVKITKILGVNVETSKRVVSTLIDNGVAKFDEKTGILYSGRLVKDEDLRKKRAKAGRAGGKASSKQRGKQNQTNGQADTENETENEVESETELEIPSVVLLTEDPETFKHPWLRLTALFIQNVTRSFARTPGARAQCFDHFKDLLEHMTEEEIAELILSTPPLTEVWKIKPAAPERSIKSTDQLIQEYEKRGS